MLWTTNAVVDRILSMKRLCLIMGYLLVLALPLATRVFASTDFQSMIWSDVPANAWYQEALSVFVSERALDSSSPFRPSDLSTKSEFI